MKSVVNLSTINWTQYLDPQAKSLVREINPDNPHDFERLIAMESDPTIRHFIVGEYLETLEDVKDFATRKPSYVTFAIVGKEGIVPKEEVGVFQGWISIYPDHHTRVKKIISQRLTPPADRYLEVGYAKYPNAASGQVSSGLRQVVSGILKEHSKKNIKVVVTGYIDPENPASGYVLTAAGFTKVGKLKYTAKSKVEDELLVIHN